MVSGTRAADADRDGASAASRAGSAAADATGKLLPDTGTISGPLAQIEVVCCVRDVTFSLKGRTAYVAAITAISTTV